MRGILRWTVEPVFARSARRACLDNLRAVLGAERSDDELRRIARAVPGHFVDYACESIGLGRHGAAFFSGRIDDRDAAARIAALERDCPRGFVGVTGHIGNWEILATWVDRTSARGLGGVIGKRLPNPWLDALVVDNRRRSGLVTLYRDDPPTRALRELRAGRALGVVPDQDIKTVSGVFVDFFGRPAYTPLGPARLALAADAPIMVGVCVRDGDRFAVHFADPIVPRKDRPKGEEVLRLTREWSLRLEQFIRCHPEQWAWFHARWKTTPERLADDGRETFDLGEA